MTLQRQRMAIPFGGVSNTEGPTWRNPPRVTQAVNVDPAEKGVLRQRPGIETQTKTIRYSDSTEWYGGNGVIGAPDANSPICGLVRNGRLDYTALYAGRIHDLGGAPAAVLDRPRYADTTWTTETIATTAHLQDASACRVLEWTSNGASWRAVITGHCYPLSASLTVYAQFYCNGTLRYQHQLGATFPVLEDYSKNNQLSVRAACDGTSVVLCWMAKGLGQYELVKWSCANPASYSAVSVTNPSAGNAITAWDITAIANGSARFVLALGSATSGLLTEQRLDEDLAVLSSTTLYTNAGTEFLDVKCSCDYDGAQPTVGYIFRQLIGGSEYVYVVFHNGTTLSTSSAAASISRSVGLCDSIAITPYTTGGHMVCAWSKYNTNGGVGTSSHATTFAIYFPTGTSIGTRRDPGYLYHVSLASLVTVGNNRVVAAVCAPMSVTGGTTSIGDEIGTHTQPTTRGNTYLVDLGRYCDDSTYAVDPTHNPTLVGVAYQAETYHIGSTKWPSGSTLPVILTDVPIDSQSASVAFGGTAAPVVGGITLRSPARAGMARSRDELLVPGGVTQIHPSGKAGAAIAFGHRPKVAVSVSGSAGGCPGGEYWYRAVWEWTSPAGTVVVSEPSDAGYINAAALSQVYIDVTHYPFGSHASQVRLVLYESRDGESYYRISPKSGTTPMPNAYASSYFARFDRFATGLWTATEEALYTMGGVLPAQMPPSAYQAVVWQRRTWLVGGHTRLWYSREHVDVEAPAFHPALTIELGGERITLVQPLGDRLLVFTERACYSLMGGGPNDVGEGGFEEPSKLLDVGIPSGKPERACVALSGVWLIASDGLLYQMTQGGELKRREEWQKNFLDRGGGSTLLSSAWSVTYAQDHHQVRVLLSGGDSSSTLVYHEDADAFTWYASTLYGQALPTAGMQADRGGIETRGAVTTTVVYVAESMLPVDRRWYDRTLAADMSESAQAGVQCTVRLSGIQFDGAVGFQRVYRVTALTRSCELRSHSLGVYPNGYGASGDTSSYWLPSGAQNQPDYGFLSGEVSREEYEQAALDVGGLWLQRHHVVKQRCSGIDVEIISSWRGYREGGDPGGSTPDPVYPFAMKVETTPVEFHAVLVEYGIRSSSGRLPEAQNG